MLGKHEGVAVYVVERKHREGAVYSGDRFLRKVFRASVFYRLYRLVIKQIKAVFVEKISYLFYVNGVCVEHDRNEAGASVQFFVYPFGSSFRLFEIFVGAEDNSYFAEFLHQRFIRFFQRFLFERLRHHI